MNTMQSDHIKMLEKENRILKNRLKKEIVKRKEFEKVKDRLDIVYQSVIDDFFQQNRMLNQKQEELEKEKLKTEEIAKYKEEFLANISHEIRTPLNAVIGYAELLSKKSVDKEQKRYIEAISTGGKTLLRLINDFLDYSRLESGKMILEPESVYIKQFVYDATTIFEEKADSKGLALNVFIDNEVPECMCFDEMRLRQVLFNLIGNAIKFTEKGNVSLSVMLDRRHEETQSVDLRFIVSDTGIGVSTQNKKKIFDAFTQQDGQSSRKYGGAGLGLAICSKLISLMGGKLFLESEYGEGSSFTVDLYGVPLCDKATVKEQHENVDIQFTEESLIYYLDDNILNLELVASIVRSCNASVKTFEKAEQLFKELQDKAPSLLILDLNLSGIDGYSVAESIIKQHSPVMYPIVLLTATTIVDKQKSTKYFNDVMHKPFSPSELISVLSKYLPYTQQSTNKHPESVITGSKEDVLKLYTELQAEVLPLLESAKKTKVFKQYIECGNIILYKALTYKCKFVEEYAVELIDAAKSFDVELLETLTQQFSDILEKMMMYLNSKGN